MMYLVFHNSHSVFVLIKHAAFNLWSGVFFGGGRGGKQNGKKDTWSQVNQY